MKKLKDKLYKLLTMDVGKESESNMESVLIRLLCCYSIITYLCQAVALAYNQYIIYCLTSVFCVGILCGAMVCTYENKTAIGSIIYLTQSLILSAVMTIGVGWRFYFAPMLLVSLLVVYFSLRVTMKQKNFASLIVIVYTVALSFICTYQPHKTELKTAVASALIILNTINIVVSLSTVAYFFCMKYMQSEEKILQYNKKLEIMVSTDPLTKLWNRRAMNEHLQLLVNEYKIHQKDFSIAIMDIDFFKHVNDNYGHNMGDYVLSTLSAMLAEHMKGKGRVCRWGGEEFLLAFEDMDYEKAIKYLDAFRQKVEAQEFTFEKTTIHISITGGITEYNENKSLDALITTADEYLYKGKTSGRNRIISSFS